MKKKISEIVFNKELYYPRLQVNPEKVKEYSELISVLPPIIINQNNIIIDGAHRYFANKEKEQQEIECEIVETKDDDDIKLKAIELNAKHGFQLTKKEKKGEILRFYKKVLNKEAKSFDVKRLKDTFSIPDSTFSDWTKDLEAELEAQRLEQILELYLQNNKYEKIAEIIGLKSKASVSERIDKILSFIKEYSENPNSENPNIPQFIKDFCINCSEFKPFLYNIWGAGAEEDNHGIIKGAYHENDDNTTFGKFPQVFMENLLYYWTKPFDVVYDPFAGGGVTIDACKKWFRRYYVSDAFPIELRKDEIKQWKIQDGLPKDLPTPDFVFLDPPYWLQAKEKYSKDKYDLGNMSLDMFYNSILSLVKALKTKMKDGYVGFVISPTQWPNNNKEFEDHIIKIITIFEKSGFKEVMRYVLPYSSEQYNGNQVNIAKKEKICLSLIRDLVIFKK